MKLKWSLIITMINYKLKTKYPIRLNAAVLKLLSLYTDPLTPMFLINTFWAGKDCTNINLCMSKSGDCPFVCHNFCQKLKFICVFRSITIDENGPRPPSFITSCSYLSLFSIFIPYIHSFVVLHLKQQERVST